MTVTMWDGVNTDAKSILQLIKPGDKVAYYIDGRFAWRPSDIALFPHNQHVTITVLGNPADVADCETGDMSPASAAAWVVKQKAAGYHRPTVYRSRSLMQDIRNATGKLVMGKDWDAWVADYDNKTSVDYEGEAAKQFKNAAYYDESVVFLNGWPFRTATGTPPVAPVTSPKWPAGQVLKQGNRGNAVDALQKALAGTGIRGVRGIAADGDFGPQTVTAVKNFESAMNIPNSKLTNGDWDGIAGNGVRSTLITHDFMNTAGQAI